MEQQFSKEGFFDLTAPDLFTLACGQYGSFYRDQSPVNAYLVSVTLFHLLDWLVKDGTTRKAKLAIEAKEIGDRTSEEVTVLAIHELPEFRAVVSAANNAKHRELDGYRPAYAKKRRVGAFAGVTRAGDSLGDEYLILDIGDEEVWLRDAFGTVLERYREYFDSQKQ
ncbi:MULTISPECIES: hypothetical protein [Burkholderia]|uniref:hypothetical protein n=1 Tax=Burkholderia TaxID=32008 RepID=UPI000B79C2F6|nr:MULTISPECIES: hypothetical protein [Burkholderia]OXI21872.1 hypothetical protein CFB43_13845 [Burkholderia sp. AU15512]